MRQGRRLDRRAILKSGVSNAMHQALVEAEIMKARFALFFRHLKLIKAPSLLWRFFLGAGALAATGATIALSLGVF